MNSVQSNSKVWEDIYSQGKGILSYPNESMVRLTYSLLVPQLHKQILDYGFGSANNLIHLARRGFAMTGVEVSPSALEIAKNRSVDAGVKADLRLIEGGGLPFDQDSFDAVIAWQVLYYNNWTGLHAAILEIERVLRPGGVFIGTMAGVGDISHKLGKALGDCEYISGAPGQEGAHLIILDKHELQRCFPDREITVGEFYYQYGEAQSRHFIISYRKPEGL